MECKCNYNPKKEQVNDAVKLECPEWMKKTMKDNMLDDEVIIIDSCMENAIVQIWKDKIITLNCCCGHGNASPTIIVSETQNIEDVFASIKKVDNRDFGVAKWSKDKERELIYYFELHRKIEFSGNEWDTIKFIKLRPYDFEL